MKLFSLISLIYFSFISLNSFAVDLDKRFGFGAGFKGLSAKFFPATKFALSVHLFTYGDFDLEKKEKKDEDEDENIADDRNYLEAYLKADYIFRLEEKMNFYWSLIGGYRSEGLGFLNNEKNVREVQLLLGGEVFLENWPNLGASVETGFAASMGDGKKVTFRPLITSTIYYYF